MAEPLITQLSSTVAPAPLITELTPDQQPVPLPPRTIEQRAGRAAFGLNTLDIGKQYMEVFQSIASGSEEQLRQEASATAIAKRKLDVQSVIRELAQRKGAQLTPEEIEAAQGVTEYSNGWYNPKSVLETAFSKRYMDSLYGTSSPSEWGKVYRREEAHRQIETLGRDYVTKDSILGTLEEEAEAALKNQSWPSYGVDIAKNLLSLGLYGEAKERGNVPGTSFWWGLEGSNVDAQRRQAFALPVSEFADAVVPHIRKMIQDNPHLAVEYIGKLRGNTDKNLDNLFSALTLGTAPGVGTAAKLLLKGGQAAVRATTEQAVRDMATASKSVRPPPVSAAIGAGDLGEAAVKQATATTVKNTSGKSNPIEQAIEALPDVLTEQTIALKKNPGKGPGEQELTNRILEAYYKLGGTVKDIRDKFLRTNQLSALLADENVVRVLKESAKEDYKGVESRVVDIKLHKQAEANINYWELQIGNINGELFGAKETAAAAARLEGIVLKGEEDSVRQLNLQRLIKQTEYELGYTRAAVAPSEETAALLGLTKETEGKLKGFVPSKALKDLETTLAKYQKELDKLRSSPGATIEQQGSHYYISLHEPINTRSPAVRAQLATKEKESQGNWGYMKNFLRWIRSPEDTESKALMDQAHVAVYGANNLLAIAKAELDAARKLTKFTLPGTSRKQAFDDLNSVLKTQRASGETFSTVGEVRDFYWRHFNRQVSDGEIEAYFSIKRFAELNAVFQDMRKFGEEARVGAQNFRLRGTKMDANGRPQQVSSESFKAIPEQQIPKGEEGILLMQGSIGGEKILKSLAFEAVGRGKQKKIDIYNDLIKQGKLQLLRLLYTEERPLKGFTPNIGDNFVKYVLTDKAEQSPLAFTRTSRKSNGMYDLDYPWYLKQAKLVPDAASSTIRYLGDKTIMPFSNGGLGKQFRSSLEQIRQHLKADQEDLAEASAKGLGIEWKEIRGWFKDPGPDGKTMLDLNHELHLVPANKLISQMGTTLKDSVGPKFRDETIGHPILKNFIKDGEADAYEMFTINDKGTRHNPVFQYEPATYIDPIPSLNRGMKTIINSLYMDDYKNMAISQWIERARGHLDATEGQLNDSPYWWFFNPTYKSGTPLEIRSALEDSRIKAERIFGTPSTTQTWLHDIAQNMADRTYGKSLLAKSALIPAWALAHAVDGGSYIRSLAFDAVMFWNPAQWLVQNMTHVTIMGIEGLRLGSLGTWGGQLHYWAGRNASPDILESLDKLASKFSIGGWKPGEWKEARELFLRTGMHHVMNDSSFINDPYAVNLFQSGAQSFLDSGRFFFREGEKSARMGAWYTSYKKWRDANPTGKITDADVAQILSRADLLAGNMSSASKSALQMGPLAFTTQFQSYSLRMLELMFGKRLSPMEKIRLTSTYLALFGAAPAVGMWSGPLPLGDSLRQAAIDYGYTASAGRWSTFAMEGFPAFFTQLITGKLYNIGERYGDLSMRGLLDGDKSTWDLLGGASWHQLNQTLTAGDPFRKAMMSVFWDKEGTRYPLKGADVDRVLKQASGYNTVSRWLTALNTGNWLSRKGEVLEKNITAMDAIARSLTGLQSRAVADLQPSFKIEAARKEHIARIEKSVLSDGAYWVKAVQDGNFGQADDYAARIHWTLKNNGYPESMHGSLMGRLATENAQALTDRSKWELYMGRSVPQDKKDRYFETYRGILEGKH